MSELIKQLRTDRVSGHCNDLRVISWNHGQTITLAAGAEGFDVHLSLTVEQARQLAHLLTVNADATVLAPLLRVSA